MKLQGEAVDKRRSESPKLKQFQRGQTVAVIPESLESCRNRKLGEAVVLQMNSFG